jgi:hypothetical protein
VRAGSSNLISDNPGGQALVRSDVTAGVAAAVNFAERRDLPDVLGLADLAHDAGTTYRTVKKRMRTEVAFLDATTFPLPKGDANDVRPMTVMNPYDEIAMRGYVGRCSDAIRKATDGRSVLNGVIDRTGPAWRTLPFAGQYKRRMALREEYYERASTGAVGFFDAKEFFPSCDHETAGSLLHAAGAPAGAVDVLTGMFGTIFPKGKGLPMGVEGSGPIANLFFGGVDRELAARGIPFIRWTDDLDTFLPDISDWDEIYEMVSDRLGAVGIALNTSPLKTGVEAKGSAAHARLFDPSRDSVFCDEDPVAAAERGFEADMMMEEFFGFTDEPPAYAFRNRLRGLRRKPSPGALDFLKARPYWLYREPRAVGDYLKVIAGNPHTRSEIDLDWLMNVAVGRAPTIHTAAGQLNACRALAAYKVDKVKAKALHDFAWDQARDGRFMALGAWAVRAWSESQGWKRSQATDLIHRIDDHGYRRAAAMGFTRMSSGDQAKHLAPIVRRHPEIEPVVNLVMSGAGSGSALP